MSYVRPLRRFQQLALDACQSVRAAGGRRAYLVLPPGAGKTVLGLEIARRLGNNTLVLTPNTAVQSQWLSQWADFTPPLVSAGADPQLSAPLSVLTYQSLCTFETDDPSLDVYALSVWRQAIEEQTGVPQELAGQEIERLAGTGNSHYRAELSRYRRKARSLIARGGKREELLALLHPNGRRIVEQMKASGPWTLILDECHHLLETWGYLVRALIEELGAETFVVGLTATPPGEMDTRQETLYRDLFGHAHFEAVAPALVKEGILAPYQELVYLTQPFAHEEAFIAAQHARFERLLLHLLEPQFATCSFVEWIVRRVRERSSRHGAQVSWSRFEREYPTLAQAALRFLHRQQLDLPEDAPLREQHRRPLDADDWVALIEDYCIGYLKHSADSRDEEAWEEIRTALPSLGYVLTRQGIRTHVSPVDRVLQLSASKAAAALDILNLEQRALGNNLRALILCDYERAGSQMLAKLRGVLDPQAGSAALLMHILLGDRAAASLQPLLVTGRTVACSRATAVDLSAWIEEQMPEFRGVPEIEPLLLASGDRAPSASWDDLVVLQLKHARWQPRQYVPLLTRYFEEGKSRCLVGTRGLLGEGWDAKRVNVLLDLTAAGTPTAVHQMRGRSLRLDPALPQKVANNWDVVCIAPDHPKGDADYARFVRKHRHYFALSPDGAVEAGVSHVSPALSPYGPPPAADFTVNNDAMRQRARDRAAAYQLWQVGSPYENVAAHTVRIRLARAQMLTQRRLRGVAPTASGRPSLRSLFAALLRAALPWRTSVYRTGAQAALEDFGAAVAKALVDAGALRPQLGPPAVRLAAQSDGYYRCYLAGASADESRLFAECLDELFAPLASPRYIVALSHGGVWRTLRAALPLRPSRYTVDASATYHAVPSYFAANRARVNIFARAWNAHVGLSEVLYVQDPRAQAILTLYRGEEPFGADTQIRTSWC